MNKGGRPKGSTNHQSAAIKDMLRAALDKVGGVDYFVKQSQENPNAFMTLIGKTIPADIQAKIEHAFEPLIIKQYEE
jgi:hypothetical protein